MRKIMLAIFVLVFFATTGFVNEIPIFDEFGSEKSSVSIFSLGNYVSNCSGVVIGVNKTQTFVLTCKHCLEISEEMYVNEKKVDTIITSPNEDLALLIIDGKIKDKEKTQIAKHLAIGDRVYTIGYPNYTFKPRKAKGKIIRFTDDWGWSTVDVIGGCSGSGLYNNRGELIGIVWGSIGEVSIFEPLKDIKNFLKKVNYETLKQNELQN